MSVTVSSQGLRLRLRLVNELVSQGTITSSWVRHAFADTPREVFVPRFHQPYPDTGLVDGANPEQARLWINQVYTDRALVVQRRDAADGGDAPTSSSTAPTVMAGMLEALNPGPGQRVLEIGTGTGYHTALLCHRVGADHVTSIELDPALADAARAALASLDLHPRVQVGDGAAGWAEAGPFDRIIATAATDHIPPAWISQLAPGGVIVTDLRGSITGSLIRLTAAEEKAHTVTGRFLRLPGAFMPLRARATSAYRDSERWDTVVYDCRNPQHTTTTLDPTLVTDDPSLRFLVQLHLAGRRLHGFTRPLPGTANELTGRATDTSWFTAGLDADAQGGHPLAQGGPQRLWDSVEAAHATWRQLGRPSIDRFGVTARDDPDQQYAWYDHPDSTHRWPLPL